jgi:transcriptional regulator with XRE-family HTH domain
MVSKGGIQMILNIEYIKKLMCEKNMSERQLAIKSGLSSATISRILTGKRGAGAKTIAGIRKAFPKEALDKLFF